MFMIEGAPSKSALFVNGTIGGYVPVYWQCQKRSGYVSENGQLQMTFILSSRAMLKQLF